MASFLFFSLFANSNQYYFSISEYELIEISESKQWQALLHMKNGRSLIDDPNFILSHGKFSPLEELKKTLQLFKTTATSKCRYPARYSFITSYKSDTSSFSSLFDCSEYQEFKRRAPIDQLSLIYASENLTQPSSAMGHIMLKMSGLNEDGIAVEHGVSFFTELNTINIPKIIWDTLIQGKKGYFQVSPYQEKLDYYQVTEQRNVWEYSLLASGNELDLVHDHIWELKEANLKYFFDSYNCATVTQALMNVIFPDRLDFSQDWLTPIDVVKEIFSGGVVSQSLLYPANKWKIRMLYELASEGAIDALSDQQFAEIGALNVSSSVGQFFNYQIAQSFNDYAFQTGDFSRSQWTNNRTLLNQNSAKNLDYLLDLSSFKSPLKKPDDTQVSIGYISEAGKEYTGLKFLPASHSIEDDNRQYFGESELKLMEFSFLLDHDEEDVELDEWNLYSTKSYVPWNSLTGGLSGELYIGYQDHYDGGLKGNKVLNLSGAIGLTHALSTDLSVFYLALGGIGADDRNAYLYGGVKLGAYLYEIFDMKTLVSYTHVYNEADSATDLEKWSFIQSFYHYGNFTGYVEYDSLRGGRRHSESLGLHLKTLF